MTENENGKMLTSYSMWSQFRDCRRRCYWRYVREVAPVEPPGEALQVGSLVHRALEALYLGGEVGAAAALAEIDTAKPADPSPQTRKAWHIAGAAIRAYLRRYPIGELEVVSVEEQFEQPIVNPETGAQSRSFLMGGKVDALVRRDGALWLVEHKTAGRIDGAYLDRLWMDFQITLYAHFVEQSRGEPVVGAIYNIVTKPKLTQRVGETEPEFEERRNELLAKSKTGKSSARRQEPEDDDAFAARLDAWYAAEDRFHREELLIPQGRRTQLRAEVWELTQAFLDARRRDAWYQNPSQCYGIGRGPCPYWSICRSNDNPVVIEMEYVPRERNEELREADLTDPAF